MADEIERKRVTLHPLKEDGTRDLEVNLYPKTLVNGIVDSDGNEVDITTQAELDDAINTINAELEEKTTDIDDIKQNILYVESDILAAKQDITDIDEKLTNLSETKQDALVRNPIVVTNENRASIVQNIISMLEDISFAADGDNSKHYDVTYRFNGAEEDSVAMRAIWNSFYEDSETIKRLTGEMDYRRFQILTNGSYTLDYDTEEHNYIRTSFDLKIAIETDAETGDSQVVVGPCPRLFGDIRFVYDYEPLVEDGE